MAKVIITTLEPFESGDPITINGEPFIAISQRFDLRPGTVHVGLRGDQIRRVFGQPTWSSAYEDEGIPNWLPVWCYRIWRCFVPFKP